MATDLNLIGIDRYQAGQWINAFQSFDHALQIDQHEEAARHFRRAGELNPQNATVVNSTLYRNHL